MAPTGPSDPRPDRHYAGYAQDRWSPNDKLTFTHRRAAATTSGSATATPSASRSSPTSRRRHAHLPGADERRRPTILVKNTNIAPRLGVTYDLTGKGRTVLKAFYGRYYNNIADSFTGANPGGQHDCGYNFLDQNRNGRYDGPSELGTQRLRIRRRLDASVDPDYKTPYDRGDQRVVRDPAAG